MVQTAEVVCEKTHDYISSQHSVARLSQFFQQIFRFREEIVEIHYKSHTPSPEGSRCLSLELAKRDEESALPGYSVSGWGSASALN